MDKRRLNRIYKTKIEGYFIAFGLLGVAMLFLNVLAGVAEIVFAIFLYIVYRRLAQVRRKEIFKNIEDISGNWNSLSAAVAAAPFPTLIVRVDTGELIWRNDAMKELLDEKERFFEMRITDYIPGFRSEWLLSGRTEAAELTKIKDRWYSVYSTIERLEKNEGLIATVSFIDRTEERKLKLFVESTRPAVGLIYMDNYDELIKGLSEKQKSEVIAGVDERINVWLREEDCLLRKLERDRYVIVCKQKLLDRFISEKFAVLNGVRELTAGGTNVTLSIGFGVGGDGYGELYSFASLALDMALSRGGDQAVVKSRQNFSFYGGKTQEMERRTKVKSRVMANALGQVIRDSSQIFIMGHSMSDLDSVGAAAGVACICRKLGKSCNIILNRERTAADTLVQRLSEQPEYEGVFISPSDAMIRIDSRSLLIVVDTNRPEVVESKDILESATRVAVIDHHRRAASYIDNAALSLHEPYASSASELVSELLGYFDPKVPLLKVEADAMLSGIVLDTKNFTMRTGVRTFEAAAGLRQAGAEPTEVKKLFQTDYDSYVDRYKLMSHAILYKNTLAIVMVDYTVSRTLAAQAADELLNVAGVQASFVVFPSGEEIIISARSMGEINVQVVLEKLGGGGHLNMAGAQIKGENEESVLAKLYAAIDETVGTSTNMLESRN